jgi:hypothetical protein
VGQLDVCAAYVHNSNIFRCVSSFTDGVIIVCPVKVLSRSSAIDGRVDNGGSCTRSHNLIAINVVTSCAVCFGRQYSFFPYTHANEAISGEGIAFCSMTKKHEISVAFRTQRIVPFSIAREICELLDSNCRCCYSYNFSVVLKSILVTTAQWLEEENGYVVIANELSLATCFEVLREAR